MRLMREHVIFFPPLRVLQVIMLIEGEIHTTPIRYDVYRQYVSLFLPLLLLDGAAAAAAEEALFF